MKRLVFVIFLAHSLISNSQEVPKVSYSDSCRLKLMSLRVDVKVIGNFATTTYDMRFFNELDRVLEGELTFPLGEGQSVTRFAMDVNGKLREAVIVEKELARKAYENTVRQNIDPALLEKTEGNNYKARIYPIPPKGLKQIVVTYEQELFTINNNLTYELPLGITETLDTFSVELDVFGEVDTPIITDNPYNDLLFKYNDNLFQAEISIENHSPLNPIVFQIPITSDKENILTYNDYFYVYKSLKPKNRIREKPKKITILWDASYSLKHRNLEKEMKLLNYYFEYLQNVEVQFISFSNTILKNIRLSIYNGNWNNVEELIRNVSYDGGTALNIFDKCKIRSDEILLFSDGLANLGDFSLLNNGTVYTVNSTISANYEVLNYIAIHSGGNFINLVKSSPNEAFNELKNETFQFLAIEHDDSVEEVYPNNNTNVTTDFSICGIFNDNCSIELLFGYQGKVTDRTKVSINRSEENKLVKRLWALQKLKFLNENKVQNKDLIISLSKQHNLISDYTSMLILDRIEDYVRYRIIPPDELKSEYFKRIKNIDEVEAFKQEEILERKKELFDGYDDIKVWYRTNYPIKEIIKDDKIKTDSTTGNENGQSGVITPQYVNEQISANDTTSANSQNLTSIEIKNIEINYNKRVISGKVVDEDELPIPGVSIENLNISLGTTTDIDGNFIINAEEHDELKFSFVGLVTTICKAGTSDTLFVKMKSSAITMEEVVVTALGVSREGKIFNNLRSETVTYSLDGSVAGICIPSLPGVSSQSNITTNSFDSKVKPLYVVDGIITVDNPINTIEPDEIDAIQVFSGESATKLYGPAASNGLVLIITKSGKEDNKEALKELNSMISERIELRSWNPNTPYISVLEKESTIESAYTKYLQLRNEYSNSPSFYLDVADYFDKKNNPQIAITVLTNLIEVELNNHELLKALAYKLEYFEQFELAVTVYKKILEIRPEDPQSYRDLALAYEQNNETQKSFNLLYKLYNGELLHKDEDELYNGIEQIAYVELNRLVTKYRKKIKLKKNHKNYFETMPVDIRVVVDWNHNDTDIDLWIVDPHGEEASYKNKGTKIGGRMSEDFIDGYGPEEFMLKNAIKGEYKILVDYYSDNMQKISGPAILKATLFTNYGRKNEKKEVIIVRLEKEEEEIVIGEFQFN